MIILYVLTISAASRRAPLFISMSAISVKPLNDAQIKAAQLS